MIYKAKESDQLRMRAMGKSLRITSIATSDDEANDFMAKHDGAAVVACFGPFVFTADKHDDGQVEHPAMLSEATAARGYDRRDKRTEKAADSFLLAVHLSRIAPDVPPYVACIDAARLLGRAKQLAALAVADCNRGLSTRQESRRENLRAQVETIAGLYGAMASCSGDPRGYVVRLHHPSMPKNGWGEGFGVA